MANASAARAHGIVPRKPDEPMLEFCGSYGGRQIDTLRSSRSAGDELAASSPSSAERVFGVELKILKTRHVGAQIEPSGALGVDCGR